MRRTRESGRFSGLTSRSTEMPKYAGVLAEDEQAEHPHYFGRLRCTAKEHGNGTPVYALGHSDRELERLSAQERLIGPATRQFFREAGIGAGMRVLDVGSGAGDAAFLAADLVGETGEVIGTDKAAAAVAAATERAQARGLRNVSFREGDPGGDGIRPTLRCRRRQVCPAISSRLGGDGAQARRAPAPGRCDRLPRAGLGQRAIASAGADLRPLLWMDHRDVSPGRHRCEHGRSVPSGIRRRGPAGADESNETFIGGGEGCYGLVASARGACGDLAPTMERLGVATAAEVEAAALAERMRRDVAASRSLLIGRSEIAAWSRA